MIVYRKKPLPAIYCEIPFLRRNARNFVDCPEDIKEIAFLQEVSKGSKCISSAEKKNSFSIAISFPDEMLNLKGETQKLLQYTKYNLRIWDVTYLLQGSNPTEAVDPEDEGLDYNNIYKLASMDSCLPFIKTLGKAYGKKSDYFLSTAQEKEIEEIERRLFARLKIIGMKNRLGSSGNGPQEMSTNNCSPKTRDRILRRDQFKCIFCGSDSNNARLEVHHIISRNTIRRLALSEDLYSEDFNLITTCFSCNRGKSDNLRKEDIDYYGNLFSNPSHPNHKILEFLRLIKDLQKL